jgi:cellulose synthase operon protein C
MSARLRFRIGCFAFGATCLSATGARAQAPVITPAGDPSVNADTIYALHVDPASQSEHDAVFLFNDGVVTLDAAGRGTRTYRQVLHILKQPAVGPNAERRLSYAPDHEKLTLNWARVLRPNGEVISAEPAQMQEADVRVAITNPVYVNQKELRLSLGGAAVNTIIDISYTIEETKPYLEGDFYLHWNVHVSAPAPVLRTRFILDLPAELQPRITERNLTFAVHRSDANGRRTFTWATADVPRYRPERFAPDTNSVHMHIVASSLKTWDDVTRWYHGLSQDQYTLPVDAQVKVRELVAAATTRLDTLRAVHRWVAQDIRYVSVSLGIGGYQPRTPEQTISTGFGDCKDKATLFIAALRSLGIEAHPVLLNIAAGAVRPEHPSIRQFNHMIAAVKEANGFTFTDLTAEFTPYGEVPIRSQGGFAVMVLPDGGAQELRLPKLPPEARKIHYQIVTTLAENGEISGYIDESNSGPGFEARRSQFGVPLDSARRANLMRALVTPLFRGARGDSIDAFNGRDLYAPVRYRLHFSGAPVAQTGGLFLLTNPFGVYPGTQAVRTLEAAPERRTSIDAEEVIRESQPVNITVDLRVTLPEGWRARVPEDVIVKGDFGLYSTEYSQEGRVLRIVRNELSAVGVYPSSRYGDVIDFFRAISADENNRQIVIEPATESNDTARSDTRTIRRGGRTRTETNDPFAPIEARVGVIRAGYREFATLPDINRQLECRNTIGPGAGTPPPCETPRGAVVARGPTTRAPLAWPHGWEATAFEMITSSNRVSLPSKEICQWKSLASRFRREEAAMRLCAPV